MALPFELTTLPSHALDILRYLADQDSYAAYDADIMTALDLSERGFGKALRRLVTKEYVELQADGTYALSRLGTDAAEAIIAHDEEARAEAAFDEDALDADEAEDAAELVARSVIVVYPKTLLVGQAANVFLRVDVPALDGAPLLAAADVTFQAEAMLDVEPARRDVSIPTDAASRTVRFTLTPTEAGALPLHLTALQLIGMDVNEAGTLDLTLTCVTGPATGTFRAETFNNRIG